MNNQTYAIDEAELADEIQAELIDVCVGLTSLEIDSDDFESIYTWFLS